MHHDLHTITCGKRSHDDGQSGFLIRRWFAHNSRPDSLGGFVTNLSSVLSGKMRHNTASGRTTWKVDGYLLTKSRRISA